jgi:hypothetical protein
MAIFAAGFFSFALAKKKFSSLCQPRALVVKKISRTPFNKSLKILLALSAPTTAKHFLRLILLAKCGTIRSDKP